MTGLNVRLVRSQRVYIMDTETECQGMEISSNIFSKLCEPHRWNDIPQKKQKQAAADNLLIKKKTREAQHIFMDPFSRLKRETFTSFSKTLIQFSKDANCCI